MKVFKENRRPAWMNSKIQDLTRRKKSTWKLYLKSEKTDMTTLSKYKEIERELFYATRRAKRQRENVIATEGKKNPRQFYAHLKSVTKGRSTVGPLKDNGQVLSSNKDMASLLNEYFTEVFTEEDLSSIPEVENLAPPGVSLDTVFFEPIKIQEKLKSLRNFSAPGPDGLLSNVLKSLSFELSFPLSILYNKIID